ncbi:phosphotransferase [Occultella kanbiaonis]|uniref:phosphotransferase n=1 Tax=Occultella kanbiaonis TaxID=2675754 RepID=UPI0013D5E2E4|nr:phosphotransferase [Occultella kanbiaonis]
MLSRTDRILAARDPRLTALPVLLDRVALQEWVSDVLGADLRVTPRYLRYKPGTSCVAAVEVTCPGTPTATPLPPQLAALPATPAGTRTVIVTAHGPDGVRKLGKTVERAPGGSVLATDQDLVAILTTVAADRDLPAAAALRDAARTERLVRRVAGDVVGGLDSGVGARQLAYKPQRRWVGTVRSDAGTDLLLRAYRPDDLAATSDRLRALERAGAATPRLLGRRTRSGLAVLEYRQGVALEASAAAEDLAAVGSALGALHAAAANLPTRDPRTDLSAARRTARQVTVLLPHLRTRIDALTATLSAGWSRAGAGTPVSLHGDFSLDQVIRAGDGAVTLIDLDHACLGPAEVDVASLAAQAVLDGAAEPQALIAAVAAGYPGSLDATRLRLHVAAQLLRRAAEPFRGMRGDWAAATEAVLARVEDLVRERLVVAS